MRYLKVESVIPVENSDGRCFGCQNFPQILCHYINRTRQFHIVRITNIPNLFFERAVPPHQSLLFETLPEAELEVYTGQIPTTIISARLPCQVLSCQRL